MNGSEHFEIGKTLTFEAAHYLPHVGEDHPCRRLHGHSYRLEVVVRGQLDPEKGWVVDYGDIAAVTRRVVGELDHRLLNDIGGLENPTSEQLAHWLWERLKAALPLLSEIGVAETPTSWCRYRGPA